ncbi:hypothetical protein [Dactylosporangium sp. NPDC051541]|uniref:hypothetical protein n=1 Tax=Dactylosporangium sp. NPDC051541 TaxID=3363977 RepID=UPI0037AEAB41
MTGTRLLILTALLLAGCAAPAAPATPATASTCPTADDRLSQVLHDALAKAYPDATITGANRCDDPWRLRYAGSGALEAYLLVRDAAGTRPLNVRLKTMPPGDGRPESAVEHPFTGATDLDVKVVRADGTGVHIWIANFDDTSLTRPDLSTDVNALVEVAQWPGLTFAP